MLFALLIMILLFSDFHSTCRCSVHEFVGEVLKFTLLPPQKEHRLYLTDIFYVPPATGTKVTKTTLPPPPFFVLTLLTHMPRGGGGERQTERERERTNKCPQVSVSKSVYLMRLPLPPPPSSTRHTAPHGFSDRERVLSLYV